jgi:hypothetical protein
MKMEIVKRKLKFSEVILLSKIFKEVEIKKLIVEITSGSMDSLLNNENLTKDQKMAALAVSVVSYIFSEIFNAEDTVYKLVASYTGSRDVSNLDSDQVVEVFQIMFTEGLPAVVKKLLGNDTVENFKKKMQFQQEESP